MRRQRKSAAVQHDFNEAGAFAPEIYGSVLLVRFSDIVYFNEAGAFAPEIYSNISTKILWRQNFNEAGAFAPEIYPI